MRLLTSDWINKIIFIGFGFLLGTQFHILFQNAEIPLQNNTGFSLQDVDSRILATMDGQKAVLKETIRTEIATQFDLLDFSKVNTPSDEKNMGAKKPVKETLEEVNISYDSASNTLTDALASGGFSQESATDFVNNLNNLPIDKQLELRAKHMDAFNRGLISSPLTPEQIMIQNK